MGPRSAVVRTSYASRSRLRTRTPRRSFRRPPSRTVSRIACLLRCRRRFRTELQPRRMADARTHHDPRRECNQHQEGERAQDIGDERTGSAIGGLDAVGTRGLVVAAPMVVLLFSNSDGSADCRGSHGTQAWSRKPSSSPVLAAVSRTGQPQSESPRGRSPMYFRDESLAPVIGDRVPTGSNQCRQTERTDDVHRVGFVLDVGCPVSLRGNNFPHRRPPGGDLSHCDFRIAPNRNGVFTADTQGAPRPASMSDWLSTSAKSWTLEFRVRPPAILR